MSKSTEHLKKASARFASAAQHEKEAAEHFEAGSDETGILHAHQARRDSAHAMGHADKALESYIEHIRLLMGEVRHCGKNMLGLIQVIARQTATDVPGGDFLARFSERIHALAANQDLLVRNEWQGVDMLELVRAHLAPMMDSAESRIVLRGEAECRLNATAAQAIGLALHELATNAGKYGALSVDTGRVELSWRVDGESFAINWSEHDGPPVHPPERHGFGNTVVVSLPEQTIGGQSWIDYAPSGVTWHLNCSAPNALCPGPEKTGSQ